ncbi:MAG TPA: hypothetical protein VF339_17490 [Gammaproteobacteria bacterium]
MRSINAAKVRPDGYIRVRSGKGREWDALVEAKIGRNDLISEQVVAYAEAARENGIGTVITISNQFVPFPAHAPVQLSRVLARHVSVFHWSWMFILTQAKLMLNEHRFANPLEKSILAEMVLYLRHDSVGTTRFDRMNREWKDLVLAVNAGRTLSRNSSEVENTVAAWQQECRDLSLLMSRNLGRMVAIKLSRAHREDPSQYLRHACELLAQSHCLECTLDIPDTASEILVRADLTRRCLTASMSLDAPRDKQRISSRVNWLLRQLTKSEEDGVFIEAKFPGRRQPRLVRLAELRTDPTCLDADGAGSLPSSFTVLMVKDLAGKFSGSRTFIEELESFVPTFYANVGQYLQTYVAKPPKPRQSEVDSDSSLDPQINDSAATKEPAIDDPAARNADDAANAALADEDRPNELMAALPLTMQTADASTAQENCATTICGTERISYIESDRDQCSPLQHEG